MKTIRVKFTAKMRESGNALYEHEATFKVEDDWRNSPITQIGFTEYKEQLLRENIETNMELLYEENLNPLPPEGYIAIPRI